jgi:hypothetical protein
LSELDLLIVVFDANRKVRGAQKSRQSLDVPPGESAERELRLSNLLYTNRFEDYGDFAVAVMTARTGPLTWKQAVPLPQMASAIRDGTPVPLESTDIVTTASECPGICLECRDRALQLCGVGCIQHFACNRTACSCEFTCKPNCKPS